MILPDLPLSTPSLLFPAISLLMLAYTNRFLALANIIRNLHVAWRAEHNPIIEAQIANLRRRIHLIRNMQATGVLSMMACTVSMAFLFFGYQSGGQISFAISLVFMIASLTITLIEIAMSGAALELHLSDMEEGGRGN